MEECKLKRYMRLNNISLREFSRNCNVQPSVICKFINGKASISKRNIDKILIATGMTYEQLFKVGG